MTALLQDRPELQRVDTSGILTIIVELLPVLLTEPTCMLVIFPGCSTSKLGKQGIQLGRQLFGGLVFTSLGGLIRGVLAILRQP